VARGKLAIVKAGAKRGQIDAQRSEVKRLESQMRARIDAQKAVIAKIENAFRQACIDYKRYEFLHKERAVSNFDFDQKKLAMETSQQELIQAKAQLQEIMSSQTAAIEAARATLDSIAEVRTVDLDAANAEIEQAEGNLAQARAALEQAYIRSPLTGKVLKIYARPGEKIAEEGFAELGRTQSMFVLAEVYQSDIAKVRLGQNVLVEADSLPGCKLNGTVKRIGQQVRKQNVINSDPTANIDERVVEVRVQLAPDASRKVQHLSNCQVTASIQI
jgi:HlyD family secretion protein